jgi:hypothetical protein
MSTQTQKTNSTISFKNIDENKLVILALEDNKLNTSQRLAMVRYENSLFQVQTHMVNLFTYGVPKEGPYYPNDKSRSFLKVPEDVNDANSVLFFEKLSNIDKYLQSPEVKNKLFGKASALYSYQPIVRTPEQMEDESVSKKGVLPRYIKLKIDLDWETSKIKTKCFQKDDSGKRVLLPNITTVDEFAKVICWKSSFVAVIIMNKLYATKNKVGDTKKYGVTFKMSNICAEQSLYKPREMNDGDAFLDTDETTNALSNIKITTIDEDILTVKVDTSNDLDNDVNEEETDESASASPEPVPEPVKPAPKTGKTPSVQRRTKQ